jgi:hypothetical protein
MGGMASQYSQSPMLGASSVSFSRVEMRYWLEEGPITCCPDLYISYLLRKYVRSVILVINL